MTDDIDPVQKKIKKREKKLVIPSSKEGSMIIGSDPVLKRKMVPCMETFKTVF